MTRSCIPLARRKEIDMRCVSRMGLVALIAAMWCHAPSPGSGQGPAPTVTLKVVKYDELTELIRANQGKVIIVDFWSLTCIPCKKNFPHVVEMYNAYKDKGLVVISVATDDINDKDKKDPRPRILAFLQDNKASFLNVLLDEPTDVIQGKLRVENLPCMYVFDRDGKWRRFIGDSLVDAKGEVRHAEIEALVKKLLNGGGTP